MKKLKVEFRRIDETVIMKVVQQDESTRSVGELFSKDGFRIMSNATPSISFRDVLCVNGAEKEVDGMIVQNRFRGVELAKEYIKKAKACIKAYNESLEEREVAKKEGRYIPELNDLYFYVDIDFATGLTSCEVKWANDEIDRYRLHTNNCFQTREEAERAIEIEKKKMELRKVFRKKEWKNNVLPKFYIWIESCKKECNISKDYTNIHEETYFESSEKAREFFNFCGADDYKKYVLGVY